MIKKVKTEHLKPGHFIHDFNCDWNGGNIFIDQTLINDPKMVDIIRSWGIEEVYIDTERGLDVDIKQTRKTGMTDIEKFIPSADKLKRPDINPAPPTIPLPVEIKEATQLRNDAINICKYNMEQIREGKSPDVNLTYELARRMRESISRNRDALLLLTRIRKKDEYTLYHSISVSSLVLDMCNFIGLSEDMTLDLSVGALFHDIGKTKIPLRILNKPARLTAIEFYEMKKHVEYSVDLLQQTQKLPFEAFDIALHHHEQYDGSGYPHKLKGDKISFGAQLTAVCDVFDAITSARCYKEGLGTVSGLQEIYKSSGTHFNRDLAHEFIRCIGVYPVGSCVKLQDGKVGVVIGSTENLLKPIVKVFYDSEEDQKITPFEINLSKSENSISNYEEPGPLGITPANLLSQMVI